MENLELNNISIYILILFHLTKFNKAIEMGSRIIRTSTRKLLSHHKIQQSRLNFIKGSIRSRWSNRCAMEIIVVGVSEVIQLGVLSRVSFWQRWASQKQQQQLEQELFCVFE